MAERPKVAVVNACMEVYPHELAEPFVQKGLEEMRRRGCEVNYLGKAFRMEEAVAKAREALSWDADLCVLLLGTWIEAPVGVSAILEWEGARPWLVWALPMVDGVSTGSLVALSVVKGTLERMGKEVKFVFAASEEAGREIAEWAEASWAMRKLKELRIGLFGYASMGMYTATFDHVRLKRHLGPEVVQVDNYRLIEEAQKVSDEEAKRVYEERLSSYPLEEEGLREVVLRQCKLYLALRRIAEEEGMGALSVKCQHEVSRTWGCTCIALSLLADDGVPCTCEGDVYPLVGVALATWLMGQHPFFADFIDVGEDFVCFSKCGFIPPSLAEGEVEIKRQVKEIGEEGAILSCVPKVGVAFALRIEEGVGGEGFRAHLVEGAVVDSWRRPHTREGGEVVELFPILRLKVDNGLRFLQNVMANHYAICYGGAGGVKKSLQLLEVEVVS